MLKTLKVVLAGTCLLVLIAVMFYSWAWSEARHARGCDRFVIDSYELRTGVNIPELTSWNCHRDQSGRRISVYTLDTDLEDYIRKAGFLKTSQALDQLLFSFDLLEPDEQVWSYDLYTVSGLSGNGEPWRMVLDRVHARLWVEIQFATV